MIILIIILYDYSLTQLFKNRKENASMKAREYHKHNAKNDEDKNYISQKYNIKENLGVFLSANFELDENENIKTVNKIFEWDPIYLKQQNKDNNLMTDNNKEDNKNDDENKDLKSENDNNNNIILKNKIISLNDNYFSLINLSISLKISILMSGESNFYIFTRCKDYEFSEKTVVCCISKELESARKFISFAVLEAKDENEFFIKNLKRQEIPHQTNHIKDLDLSEISFTFLDNGDDRCFVFLDKEEKNSNIILMGDFYEPINYLSNVMLACTGDLISLKELEIKQIQRGEYAEYRTVDKVNLQCCNIF